MTTYLIVDAETGETHSTQTVGSEPQAQRDFKGWLLRTRTAYKRRTGHRLTCTEVAR